MDPVLVALVFFALGAACSRDRGANETSPAPRDIMSGSSLTTAYVEGTISSFYRYVDAGDADDAADDAEGGAQ